MTLDELLLEWSYRSEKGYPSMGSPSDISVLKGILKELKLPEWEINELIDNLEEKRGDEDGNNKIDGMDGAVGDLPGKPKKYTSTSTSNNDSYSYTSPSFTKDDLINLISTTDISDKELKNIAKNISSLVFTTPITDYLSTKAQESNIDGGSIRLFKELIEKYGIQQEFAEYIKNPVDLDINKNNFTDSIPSLPADKLKILFRSMPTTIIGNVSVGPGEVLFSILFKNVKKRDSKGDLDIGNLNVEVKASIGAAKKAEDEKGGDAGAVVAKGYGRGAWSSTRKTGEFDTFVSGLGMSEENTDDALKLLDDSLKWPLKIASIYDVFTKDENFNKETFIKGFDNVLRKIYHKSSFIPRGTHFNLDSYFSEQDFNSKEFEIGIARELIQAYKDHEGFDGMLYLNRSGDMKFFNNKSIIQSIGTDIIIKSFSDDVPRLLFPGHS